MLTLIFGSEHSFTTDIYSLTKSFRGQGYRKHAHWILLLFDRILDFWAHYTSQYDMDVVRPVTTKIRKISSQTLYLCPARYLSAFLVRPGRERRLCVFSILARKKTLVDLDNQGI